MERKLIKRGLRRIILLPIVLSVLFAGLLLWQLNRMLSMNDWVEHTTQVLTLSSEAQRHAQFQESELRGYLLVHSLKFVDRFNKEEVIVDSLFQKLHTLTIDSHPQTVRLDSLMQFYWTWQTLAQHAITGANTSADTSSMSREIPRRAIADMATQDSALIFRTAIVDSMRREFGQINREERRLYAERKAQFKNGTELLTIIITVVSIVLGLIVGLNGQHHARRFINRFSAMVDETNRNRDLLETMLLSVGDGIIVAGTDGNIMLMNYCAERLIGWKTNEVKGLNLTEVFNVVSEDYHIPIQNPVSAVLRDRMKVEDKGRILLISRSGVYYPIEQIATPVHDKEHEIVAVVICFNNITELRESEREAERREAEIRLLVENSPDAIMRYSSDLTITYANSAIEQMLDLKPRWLIGKRFKNVGIPEETYEPWEQSIRKIFETGRMGSMEIQYRTTRGLKTYDTRLVPEDSLSTNKNLSIADRSRIRSVISISRDITDIKHIEQNLRDSEQRFRGIVENSPEAFYTLRAIRENTKNPKSRIVNFVFEHINQRGAELITVSASECIGRKLTDIMPGDRPHEFIEKYARILDDGKSTYEEYHVETPYVKGARWLHSQYIPFGNVLAISTIDITSRKQTVLALQGSEERFRRLIEHASEAIFTTGRDGRFTYANQFIRELAGYDLGEITRYSFTDLIPTEHRTRVERHFFRQFISRSPFSYIEAPFCSKDETEIWLGITTWLRINGEEIGGFDCIAIDITARKKIESDFT